MKSINFFTLNILLIGGLTIPTCNKANAANSPNKLVAPIFNTSNIINSLPISQHFKNYAH